MGEFNLLGPVWRGGGRAYSEDNLGQEPSALGGPLLPHLPTLPFDSLPGSPPRPLLLPTSGWDSPLGTTPVKGSRLTMSRLASPVGSFSTPVGSPSFPFTSQSPPSPTLLDWNKAQLTSPPRGFSTLPEPSLRAVPPLSWPTS